MVWVLLSTPSKMNGARIKSLVLIAHSRCISTFKLTTPQLSISKNTHTHTHTKTLSKETKLGKHNSLKSQLPVGREFQGACSVLRFWRGLWLGLLGRRFLVLGRLLRLLRLRLLRLRLLRFRLVHGLRLLYRLCLFLTSSVLLRKPTRE